MDFVIMPITDLQQIDPNWEDRRKSNDGTQAIIHRELLDQLRPPVMTLPLLDEEVDVDPKELYAPYQLVSDIEINNMEQFKPKDEDLNNAY